MSVSARHRRLLLEHARRPHHFGDLLGAQSVGRGSNPLCGDHVEVGLRLDADGLVRVDFHGNGCTVCMASASLMTDLVCGRDGHQVRELVAAMKRWFTFGDGASVPPTPPSLAMLDPVRDFPARRRCVLLAWEALDEALRRLS